MRTLAIGDIHGCYKALVQCLERCNFDPLSDRLIIMGDVCDGWPFVRECCDLLQMIPNHILIIGNHDRWACEWAEKGWMGHEWVTQGGQATLDSFGDSQEAFPLYWFHQGVFFHEEDNQVFVHGGLDPNQKVMSKQDVNVLLWDRNLVQSARNKCLKGKKYSYGVWDDIFVGHTTTQAFEDDLVPLTLCNVIMTDTGGGWSGKLTIMDVDSKKYWQSDYVKTLYPDIKGR